MQKVRRPCWASADVWIPFLSNSFRDQENISYDIVSTMDKSQHFWSGQGMFYRASLGGGVLSPPSNPPQFEARRFFNNSKKLRSRRCAHSNSQFDSTSQLRQAFRRRINDHEPEHSSRLRSGTDTCGGSHILKADSPAICLLTYECIILLAKTQSSL